LLIDMTKKAFIYDLDNTVYPVPSIGEKLFAPLFQLIRENGAYTGSFDKIRDEIMRTPFQVVAQKYQFSQELTQKAVGLLRDLTYEGDIQPYPDYPEIRNIPGDRFLVTTGFRKLQESKIRGMGIEADFRQVIVVDPDTSDKTKKDIFAGILQQHGYQPAQVLVIGDDPGSEIKAARELGLDTVLYDKENRHPNAVATFRISDFRELKDLLKRTEEKGKGSFS
jgi:putative hydrolase of the HAD superfamily